MREVARPSRPQLRLTLLDRVIGWFDPVRGAERARGRAVLALTGGAYTGASKDRRSMSAWNPRNPSANAAVLWDLPTLRSRSRDLVRNNPLATGAVNTVITRVVGTGLAMQPAVNHEILGLTREEAATWQRAIRPRWELWAESSHKWCDITRSQNFYGLQSLAMRATLEAGDVFPLLPLIDERGRPNALAIKLVEGDRVVNPTGEHDKPQLAGGIRMDEDGRPTDYYILREHPGTVYGATSQGDWIPAFGERTGRRNVLHLYDPRRPGQARGVPYLAPVMEPLKQLGRYTDAEIDAAVISSFFTVFTVSEGGEGLDPAESAVTGQTPSGADSRKGNDWKGELSSGLVVDLPDKTDIKFADPSRPNQAFDPFVLAILRQIGVALEIPFELLVKHFTSSYTAARAALLDFWLFVRHRREWMAAMFCQPVYEEWLRIEVASGRVAAPGFFTNPLARQAWCGAYWVGDAMGVLDPQREANAVEKYLDLGLTTREKETMKHDGSNWEDNHEQLVREHEAREAAGFSQRPTSASNSEKQANGEADNDDE